MGLYARVDLEDLGFYPFTLKGEIEVNYSRGFEVFEEVFSDIISGLCPVRTGNLIESINCDWGDMEIYAETLCDYAEYVEYGTWCMEAQPYFEAAVENAFYKAYGVWVEAYEEALEEEYWFVFGYVYNLMIENPWVNDYVAEIFAHNAAEVTVAAQRTYLRIDPTPPDTIIIQENNQYGKTR